MILKAIQFLFLMLFPIKDALLSQEIIIIAIVKIRNSDYGDKFLF